MHRLNMLRYKIVHDAREINTALDPVVRYSGGSCAYFDMNEGVIWNTAMDDTYL